MFLTKITKCLLKKSRNHLYQAFLLHKRSGKEIMILKKVKKKENNNNTIFIHSLGLIHPLNLTKRPYLDVIVFLELKELVLLRLHLLLECLAELLQRVLLLFERGAGLTDRHLHEDLANEPVALPVVRQLRNRLEDALVLLVVELELNLLRLKLLQLLAKPAEFLAQCHFFFDLKN